MNITVFNGSPKAKGNTAALIEAFANAARAKGHAVKVHPLHDLKIGPCTDCGYCKTKGEDCVLEDEFSSICAPAIEKSDVLVFASPVYFGQITGPTKTFLDRWCQFFNHEFEVRRLTGKKFLTIVTSAAPAKRFQDVTQYLCYWFGDFFKLEHKGSLMAGELMGPNALASKPHLLTEAANLAGSL